MTLEEMEKKLTYLLDRQAIYDVVASYSRLVDRLDRDVLDKVYHEDAIDDHSMFVGNREEFFDWVHRLHSTEQHATQHNIGTHLCEIDGNVAHTETYFIYGGMNVRGAPFSLIAGRYIDRLEKRNGKWAIVERKHINDWAAPSINTREAFQTPQGATNNECIKPFEWDVVAAGPRSSRDRSDPSYDRPLSVPESRRRQYREMKAAAAGKPPNTAKKTG
jgi:SnoaL-like domain